MLNFTFKSIGKEINILLPPTWTETGHLAEVFSWMTRRLSSFGAMKKISLESSPCSQELVLLRSSTDSAEPAHTLKPSANSPTMSIEVTLLHAQPTSVPPWELQSTLNCQNLWQTSQSSIRSLLTMMSRSEVFMVSIPILPPEFSISPTREDSEEPRNNSSKTWSTVSDLSSMLRRPRNEYDIAF